MGSGQLSIHTIKRFFFQTGYTKYNFRSRSIKPSIWNNLAIITNSFITRLPIQLVAYGINCLHILNLASSKFSDFTSNLKGFDFSKLGPSCHWSSCIQFYFHFFLAVYVILTLSQYLSNFYISIRFYFLSFSFLAHLLFCS